MNVWVYGAGAVGSLLGGRLATAGERVTLLCRAAHAQAIRERGLRIEMPDGARTEIGNLDVVTELAAAPRDPDLVLVTVKGDRTQAAAEEIAACAPRRARVLSFQNGVGHEETLAARLGGERVLACATTIAASLVAPGHVVQHNRGGVGIAPWSGADPAPIAAALATAGLRTRVYARALDLKWSKLLLNLLGNATAAIVDQPPEAIYADPQLFAIDRRAFLEALDVMPVLRVDVVDLPGFPVRLLARVMRLPGPLVRPLLRWRMATGRGGKLPSFLADLRRGAPRLEVAYVNGAVARAAAQAGLAAPANAKITTLLEEIASGARDGSPYRQDPTVFVAAVEDATRASRGR